MLMSNVSPDEPVKYTVYVIYSTTVMRIHERN